MLSLNGILFLLLNCQHAIFCISNSLNCILQPSKEKFFSFADAKKIESLRFKRLNDKTVYFIISSTNKITGAKTSISGTAHTLENVMDPETDSDVQGDSYFVDEHFFGGECGLKIRIDDDKELYAKIYESKCMSMKYINKYGVSFDCRNVMHIVK